MANLRSLRALALVLAGALVSCCPPALQAGVEPVSPQATSFAAVVEESGDQHARARLLNGTAVRLDLGAVAERPAAGTRVHVEGTLMDGSTVQVAVLTQLGTVAAAPR